MQLPQMRPGDGATEEMPDWRGAPPRSSPQSRALTDPTVTVTLYWRPGCPYCIRLRRGLRRARVTVPEVNIWEAPDGAAVVRGVAGGNETVPTLIVGDQSLVNPPTRRAVEAIRTYAPELIGSEPERRARLWRRR